MEYKHKQIKPTVFKMNNITIVRGGTKPGMFWKQSVDYVLSGENQNEL